MIQFGNIGAARKSRFFFMLSVPVLVPTRFFVVCKITIAWNLVFLLVFL